MVDLLTAVAGRKKATPAQVALELNAADLKEIDVASSKIQLQGDRYPAHLQKLVGR